MKKSNKNKNKSSHCSFGFWSIMFSKYVQVIKTKPALGNAVAASSQREAVLSIKITLPQESHSLSSGQNVQNNSAACHQPFLPLLSGCALDMCCVVFCPTPSKPISHTPLPPPRAGIKACSDSPTP